MEIDIVEIASPDVVAKAAAFTLHIDRLPLPVKSTPGFLVNRVLMPYLLEAVVLGSEGVSARVIDQVPLEFGMPMGAYRRGWYGWPGYLSGGSGYTV